MRSSRQLLFYSFILIAGIPAFSGRGAENGRQSASRFENYRQAQQRIDPARLDRTLLEQTLIYFTNQERLKHSLKNCSYEVKLWEAARAHSEEMNRLDYFAHESPVRKNRLLDDRMKNAGMWTTTKSIFFGENIGVDYFLAISGVPFYERKTNGRTLYLDSRTDDPIGYQTYWEFAQKMVKNWMDSPGHRKNILKKEFDRIGIGASQGIYHGYPAIYVTQNFFGSQPPTVIRK
jgi:uncharacterized protein YkwD